MIKGMILVLICFILNWSVVAREDVVRVAFLTSELGFYQLEEKGGLSGYNYEYLMEVAQYTGWVYEFVACDTYGEAIGLLSSGAVDLLGPMFIDQGDRELYAIGEKPSGISRHTLCTLSSNGMLTEDNYFLRETLSVALVQGETDSIEAFYRLMEQSETELDVVYVGTKDEALQLLVSGEVETMMSLDVASNYGVLVPIASIDPTPYYFFSTLGNDQLVAELDAAIGEIEISEPGIHQRLLSEYFTYNHVGLLHLSQWEQEVLAQYEYFTVGLLCGMEPYQFYEEGTVSRGITYEIMEELSGLLGVPFRYVWVESMEKMAALIEAEEVDFVGSLPYEYETSRYLNVVLTRPYLTAGAIWLHHQDEKDSFDVDVYVYSVSSNIPMVADEDLFVPEDIEETIRYLGGNGDISLFCDPYIGQYYVQKLGLTDVEMQNVSSVLSQMTLGVGKHVDTTVIGVLNHGMQHLDPFEVDEIVYRNVTHTGGATLREVLEEYAPAFMAGLIVVGFILIVGLVYYVKQLRQMARQDGLTKLYNSGYFHYYAEEKTKKYTKGVLILFDIDFFKQVNDTYGHQAGDKVIVTVAKNIKRLFGEKGTVARLGGDEFVVLLEGDFCQQEMEEKCRILLKDLSQTPDVTPVSLSIGGFLYHEYTPYKSLYSLADGCLYEVKESGRNGFKFSDRVL